MLTSRTAQIGILDPGSEHADGIGRLAQLGRGAVMTVRQPLARVSLRVPDVDGGGRMARHALVRVLRRWAGVGDEVRDTAELLACELITNALRHAAGPAGRQRVIVLRAARHEDQLLIEVQDPDPTGLAVPPAPAEVGPFAEGGRGLLTVSQLAKEWGVRTSPTTKTVWFTLAL